jgi:eukaryotic-like serine/threonine-protein kinase
MKWIWLFMVCIVMPVVAQKNKKKTVPVLKWSFSIKQPFIGSPVVDHGTVYIGGLDSALYALNAVNGEQRWKFKTRGPIRSAGECDATRVYLNGGDGVIYALDKQTGKPQWMFSTFGAVLGERTYDAADYFHSKPLKADNLLYVGSGDGRLYALNIADGTVRWTFKANNIIHTSPVLHNDKVIFGSSDGFLYAINKVNGDLVWKFKSAGHRYFPAGEMQGSPVVSQGLVFIGSRDYNLYAVEANEGYGYWNKAFPQGWATALTATDSVLYAGTSDDKLFLALDPSTGKELWRFEAKFNIFGPAAVGSSSVYVGTQMGKIFSLDKKSGSVQWSYLTKGYQTNHLKYFKADDTFRDDLFNNIRTFDDYLKMLYSLGAVYSTPALFENTVIISTAEGVVYCLQQG